MTVEPDRQAPEGDPARRGFATDTACRQTGDGEFAAHLPEHWVTPWGAVNGGLGAGVAVRSVIDSSALAFPATAAIEFLSPLRPGEARIVHEALRPGERLHCVRARMFQQGRHVLDATVWMTGGSEAFEHDLTNRPDYPQPDELPTVRELLADEGLPLIGMWDNIEVRPRPPWVPYLAPVTRPPVDGGWLRLDPPIELADPGVSAAALLTMADIMTAIPIGFPHGHNGATSPHFPMTLSLTAQFFDLAQPHEWVCLEAEAPVATRGLAGAQAMAWSPDGRLMATATSQMILRRSPPSL